MKAQDVIEKLKEVGRFAETNVESVTALPDGSAKLVLKAVAPTK